MKAYNFSEYKKIMNIIQIGIYHHQNINSVQQLSLPINKIKIPY